MAEAETEIWPASNQDAYCKILHSLWLNEKTLHKEDRASQDSIFAQVAKRLGNTGTQSSAQECQDRVSRLWI